MIVKPGADGSWRTADGPYVGSRRRVSAFTRWTSLLDRLPFARGLSRRPLTAGFTAAEMLVATAIAAVIVGAAALAFSTVTRGQRQITQSARVRLPSGALTNFYNASGTDFPTYIAPNFGSVARAEYLRERFVADCAQSIAVYCLYRNNGTWNTYRPSTIASPAYGAVLDTPEAFRVWLAATVTTTASLYRSYRNVENQPTTLAATPGVSIFVLGYSANATTIPVLAVYDIDFVQATNPNGTGTFIGTYASVRRYVAGSLTAYYDIVYPPATLVTGQTESWTPTVVAFERRSRLAVAEGSTTADRFKIAAEQPFYFIFWPDPAKETLAIPLDAFRLDSATSSYMLNPDYATTDPRRSYNHMAGRTSFMFTVPLFPSS